MDEFDSLWLQETADDSVIDGQDDEATPVTACTHAPVVGSDAYAALRHWLHESFPAASENYDSSPAAAAPEPRQCSVSPTLPSLMPVPLRELLVSQPLQSFEETAAPKSSSMPTCDAQDRAALHPSSAGSEDQPASRPHSACSGGSAFRPHSTCSSGSAVSESVLELVAAAHDPVWKRLTKHFAHTHSRRKPIEWQLMRMKTIFTGCLRLSLLGSESPEVHGLEMPSTGDAVVDGETGVFRTEDELAAFHRKMADMKAMLDDELEELRDQELGTYAKHIEEDVQARKIFDEMQAILKQEMQELKHQEHVIELEVREKLAYPEPVITRPDLATADDEYSRRLRKEGLKYKSSNDTMAVLHYDDLPPELDLSAVLSNSIPIPEPKRASPLVTTPDNGVAKPDTQSPPPPPPALAHRPLLADAESVPDDHLNSTTGTLCAVPGGSSSPPVGEPRNSLPSTSFMQPTATMLSGLWSTLSSLGSSSGSDKTAKPASPVPLPHLEAARGQGELARTRTAPTVPTAAAVTVARKRGIPAHPSLDSGVTVMRTTKRGLL